MNPSLPVAAEGAGAGVRGSAAPPERRPRRGV